MDNLKYSVIGSRDEIDTLFKMGEKEGIIDEDHNSFVTEILSFRKLTANEVMTPTIDVFSIEERQSLKR